MTFHQYKCQKMRSHRGHNPELPLEDQGMMCQKLRKIMKWRVNLQILQNRKIHRIKNKKKKRRRRTKRRKRRRIRKRRKRRRREEIHLQMIPATPVNQMETGNLMIKVLCMVVQKSFRKDLLIGMADHRSYMILITMIGI